ncbi:MAG TPA: zinc-ribbon domain-containing protein [Gemmatimonadota bacterium]|nr:zinc-ribbon domain-containing protein [Gemmatimonadota bacterium]
MKLPKFETWAADYCTRCGRELRRFWYFCPDCGKR